MNNVRMYLSVPMFDVMPRPARNAPADFRARRPGQSAGGRHANAKKETKAGRCGI